MTVRAYPSQAKTSQTAASPATTVSVADSPEPHNFSDVRRGSGESHIDSSGEFSFPERFADNHRVRLRLCTLSASPLMNTCASGPARSISSTAETPLRRDLNLHPRSSGPCHSGWRRSPPRPGWPLLRKHRAPYLRAVRQAGMAIRASSSTRARGALLSLIARTNKGPSANAISRRPPGRLRYRHRKHK